MPSKDPSIETVCASVQLKVKDWIKSEAKKIPKGSTSKVASQILTKAYHEANPTEKSEQSNG